MESQNYQNILSSSMSLMRRLPPMSTIKNLAAICELIQDDEVRDDVMIKSDQPLRKSNSILFSKFIYHRGRHGWWPSARISLVRIQQRRRLVSQSMVQQVLPTSRSGRWPRLPANLPLARLAGNGGQSKRPVLQILQAVLRLRLHHLRLLFRHRYCEWIWQLLAYQKK